MFSRRAIIVQLKVARRRLHIRPSKYAAINYVQEVSTSLPFPREIHCKDNKSVTIKLLSPPSRWIISQFKILKVRRLTFLN